VMDVAEFFGFPWSEWGWKTTLNQNADNSPGNQQVEEQLLHAVM